MEIKKNLKNIADTVANKVKIIEENNIDSELHILNMDRSIQIDNYSYGVQSVFTILKYFSKARSIENVEKLLKTTYEGTDENEMYKLFRSRGLTVFKRLNVNLPFLKKSIDYYQAPMLTTIDDGDHYIVVYGYSNASIFVLDSVAFRPFVKWSKEKFFSQWDKWGAIIHS